MALLRNTGFESDAAWTLVDGATYVTSPVHSGSRALSIRFVQGTLLPPRRSKYGAARQAITTKTGTRIDLSAWAKPVPGGLSLVALRVENPTGAEPEVVDSLLLKGGDWKLLSGSIVAAGGSVTVEVIAQAGAWFVDDVRAVKPSASWSTPADPRTVPPPVDPQLVAFRAECLGWEREAARLGNVVTVDGIHPERAQYETIMEAWRAIRSRCSPTNPYIIQVAKGFQWPKNAATRGIIQDQCPVIQDHPGGLVIRGSGWETVFWIPEDFRFWLSLPSLGQLHVESARVFIRDCTLGLHNGITRTTTDPGESICPMDYPLVQGFEPAQSVCHAREDRYEEDGWKAYGCAYTVGKCIILSPKYPSKQTAVYAYNCRMYSAYDFCMDDAWGNGSDTTPTEPPMLVVHEKCQIIMRQENEANKILSSNDDGYSTGIQGNALVWCKDCTAEGDTFRSFLYMRAPGWTSQYMRPEPAKYWFENLDWTLSSAAVHMGSGSSFMVVAGSMRPGCTIVFKNCRFRWRSQLLKQAYAEGWPLVGGVPSLWDGRVLYGAGFGVYPATNPGFLGTPPGGTVDMYFRNCVFDVDLTYVHRFVTDHLDPAAKWFLFNVFTSSGRPAATVPWHVTFYVGGCKYRIRGSTEDLSHYVKFDTSHPDNVTFVEE